MSQFVIDEQSIQILNNLLEMVVSKKLELQINSVVYDVSPPLWRVPYTYENDDLTLTFSIIKEEEEKENNDNI